MGNRLQIDEYGGVRKREVWSGGFTGVCLVHWMDGGTIHGQRPREKRTRLGEKRLIALTQKLCTSHLKP